MAREPVVDLVIPANRVRRSKDVVGLAREGHESRRNPLRLEHAVELESLIRRDAMVVLAVEDERGRLVRREVVTGLQRCIRARSVHGLLWCASSASVTRSLAYMPVRSVIAAWATTQRKRFAMLESQTAK